MPSVVHVGRLAPLRSLPLAVLVYMAACAPGIAQIETKRAKFVLAGHTIQLAYYYSLQIDCTPNPIPEIVVVKRPALGRVRIDKASLYPTYGAGNVRSVCNAKRTPTRQISYTASPDHKGDDEVAIEIYWHSGRKDGVTFVIHVQ